MLIYPILRRHLLSRAGLLVEETYGVSLGLNNPPTTALTRCCSENKTGEIEIIDHHSRTKNSSNGVPVY